MILAVVAALVGYGAVADELEVRIAHQLRLAGVVARVLERYAPHEEREVVGARDEVLIACAGKARVLERARVGELGVVEEHHGRVAIAGVQGRRQTLAAQSAQVSTVARERTTHDHLLVLASAGAGRRGRLLGVAHDGAAAHAQIAQRQAAHLVGHGEQLGLERIEGAREEGAAVGRHSHARRRRRARRGDDARTIATPQAQIVERYLAAGARRRHHLRLARIHAHAVDAVLVQEQIAQLSTVYVCVCVYALITTTIKRKEILQSPILVLVRLNVVDHELMVVAAGEDALVLVVPAQREYVAVVAGLELARPSAAVIVAQHVLAHVPDEHALVVAARYHVVGLGAARELDGVHAAVVRLEVLHVQVVGIVEATLIQIGAAAPPPTAMQLAFYQVVDRVQHCLALFLSFFLSFCLLYLLATRFLRAS